MNSSRLIFLRKDDGNLPTDVSNCRVVSVIPTFVKLAEKILLRNLDKNGIYTSISRSQTGFIPYLALW